MKSRFALLLACLCTALFVAPMAQASEADHRHAAVACLKEAVGAFTQSYSHGELVKIQRDVGLLKIAELSYQDVLVTPFMTIGECKPETDLGVMNGMYVFDANYALVFGKQGEFLQANRAIQTEIRPRLAVSSSLSREPIPADLLKNLAADPFDTAAQEAFFQQVQKNTDALAGKAAEDAAVFNHLMDVAYGGVVQGLYVTLSLAVDADMAGPVADLLKAQAKRIAKLDAVMLELAKHPVGAYAFYPDRFAFLEQAAAALASGNGQPKRAELATLLSRVALERGKYTLQCK